MVENRGIRKVCIAEMLTDGGTSGYTTDKWNTFAGCQAVAEAEETVTETHFYDNKPAIIVDGIGTNDITLTVSVLDLKTRALIEGRRYDANNDVMVDVPNQERPYFALGYIAKETDGTEKAKFYYKGKFTGGDETHNTENNGTEATNVQYVYHAIYTDSNISTEATVGKAARKAFVTLGTDVTEAALFGTFTGGVSTIEPLTPDEIIAL